MLEKGARDILEDRTKDVLKLLQKLEQKLDRKYPEINQCIEEAERIIKNISTNPSYQVVKKQHDKLLIKCRKLI